MLTDSLSLRWGLCSNDEDPQETEIHNCFLLLPCKYSGLIRLVYQIQPIKQSVFVIKYKHNTNINLKYKSIFIESYVCSVNNPAESHN